MFGWSLLSRIPPSSRLVPQRTGFGRCLSRPTLVPDIGAVETQETAPENTCVAEQDIQAPRLKGDVISQLITDDSPNRHPAAELARVTSRSSYLHLIPSTLFGFQSFIHQQGSGGREYDMTDSLVPNSKAQNASCDPRYPFV